MATRQILCAEVLALSGASRSVAMQFEQSGSRNTSNSLVSIAGVSIARQHDKVGERDQLLISDAYLNPDSLNPDSLVRLRRRA
jgi:predicted component of type VI protein secretion system